MNITNTKHEYQIKTEYQNFDVHTSFLRMKACVFCSKNGKTENSSAYCAGCQKYMCVACWKLHAEILSAHRLKDRTKIRSKEVNTCEELEWFCENDVCLLCNVCKMVDHQQCTLRKIEDIVAKKDVKQEFENNLADLVRLRDTFNERIDKTKKDIESYSNKNAGVIEKINNLQIVLNQIFERFKTDVGVGEAENMEMLQAKLISYQNSLQMIESHLGVIKSIKLDGRNDKYIFTSAIKMKKKVSKFTALSQRKRVQTDMVDGAKSQCISERMQNRRLRNGQTFTGARAFSRQKCFVQFFIQNCTLRMYCYIGLACPSTIFQNTIISGMEAL